ncbi:Fis family transcriptional regulator [Nocardia yamanashiensis]|uniref:sigma-54-dependent Fis family transcriptional regulator n=1 Tax=Nocardia yamanashiensis TaxID=209247 RepID=UPI001E4C657C|nr:helix-turn-helix domain-containing protein [Nocardia yamanashiensis]UGT45007.1 Fis family transcriptional regulator [Nocardia yamanashiensis]
MDPGDEVVRVERARDSFVTDGEVRPGAVSGLVLASWRRSLDAGVSDLVNVLDRGYQGELDLTTRFVNCAVPVIERLQTELAELPVTIALTDQRSRVLVRRDNQRFLSELFDEVYFAPGFVYSEDSVGTNGVGTALAAGKPVFIQGPEHFAENITVFACAGAPVRDPLTGAVQGVLDLSCLAQDANPLMPVLIREAARHIEAELRATGSLRQQAVLDRFLRVARAGRGPVVALGGDVFMTDARADAELSAHDRGRLREVAVELAGAREGTEVLVDLPTGRTARVQASTVLAGAEVAGVVLQVDLAVPQPRAERRPARTVGIPELPGVSPIWRAAGAEVLEAARANRPVVVHGESGTGKLTLITAAHRRVYPTRPLVIIECRSGAPRFDRQWPGSEPATIVLAHVDELDPRHAPALAARLHGTDHGKHWLVATVTTDAEAERARSEEVLRHFGHSVTVPALRHRLDDLTQLVPHLLRTLAPRREVACAPDAMRVLFGHDWPGNIAELRDALHTALTRRPAGALRRADLPETCFVTGRRTLSQLEAAERSAIVRALTQTGGNRHRAAQQLGIARSSLYRKIELYGIKPIR